MNYNKSIQEFAKVRMEQSDNNTQVARDIVNKFELDKSVDAVRKWVAGRREYWKIKASGVPIKRLFFDIETGYYILKVRAWGLKNYNKYFDHNDIEQEKEILCISYMWQGDDKVYRLDRKMGEKKMLKEFIKIMGEADECIGHNGDGFDIKEIRTRCIYHGVLMFPNYRTLDTLKKSRSSFRFASNKLDYIAKFLNVGGKLEHRGFDMWKDIVEGDKKTSEAALEEMGEYCDRDVVILADTYFVLSPFITHNNNFAVLRGGEKWHCPECTSDKVKMHHTYTTGFGIVRREMKCDNCKKQYRVSNKTYMSMLIDSVK